MHIACILGDEDIACALLDFIIDVISEMDSKLLLFEILGRHCGSGNTLLHLASYMGMSVLVRKLIESGASIHKKNELMYKPVDLAIDQDTLNVFNNLPIGKILLFCII